jgi:Ankyrin repeats (3 copies)
MTRMTLARAVIISLAVLALCCPALAYANMGLPMVALYLPPAWFALLPVIAIEWAYGVKRLKLPVRRALVAQAAANCVSTLIGLPLTWIVLALVELFVLERVHGVAPVVAQSLAMVFGAAWLLPGAERTSWMIPWAVAVLTAIFYVMSVLSEHVVIARFFSDLPRRAIWRWMIRANALSYILLMALIVAGWLSGASAPVVDVTLPISNRLVEAVFQVGNLLSNSPGERQIPLIRAAEAGDLRTIQALIAKGVNVNESDAHGRTALYAAATQGHEDATRVLLRAGANIHARHNVGYEPIHSAAQYGNCATVKALLAAGAGVNDPLSDGWTPLMIATLNGRPEVVEVLLGAGADVNARSPSGWTALKEAQMRGYANTVARLLQAGAIDYPDGSR